MAMPGMMGGMDQFGGMGMNQFGGMGMQMNPMMGGMNPMMGMQQPMMMPGMMNQMPMSGTSGQSNTII
jgi:hypothetical protein